MTSYYFQKLTKLEAKFDALKSLVTHKISNLANKFDSSIGFKQNIKNTRETCQQQKITPG